MLRPSAGVDVALLGGGLGTAAAALRMVGMVPWLVVVQDDVDRMAHVALGLDARVDVGALRDVGLAARVVAEGMPSRGGGRRRLVVWLDRRGLGGVVGDWRVGVERLLREADADVVVCVTAERAERDRELRLGEVMWCRRRDVCVGWASGQVRMWGSVLWGDFRLWVCARLDVVEDVGALMRRVGAPVVAYCARVGDVLACGGDAGGGLDAWLDGPDVVDVGRASMTACALPIGRECCGGGVLRAMAHPVEPRPLRLDELCRLHDVEVAGVRAVVGMASVGEIGARVTEEMPRMWAASLAVLTPWGWPARLHAALASSLRLRCGIPAVDPT